MDTPRWNDAQLDAMRQTQDSVADPVVAALFGAGKVALGTNPFTTGLPLTITFPKKFSNLVARYLRGLKVKSSGVVSMSVVVARPFRKTSSWRPGAGRSC